MAQVSKDSELDISQDFIESGKKLTHHKKKGGPHSKDEKIKRLNEVYRLHFDYGYSARKISEMMNINRNTVNGDIDNLYAKAINNSNYLDPEPTIVMNIQRLNIQRTRLRENLNKVENFQHIHAIEKMIFDIDCKIINTHIKLANSLKRIHKLGIGYLNDYLKDNRYMTYLDRISVSEKAQQKISKIIKEDRPKTGI